MRFPYAVMFLRLFLALCFLAIPAAAEDHLMVCGADEVVRIDLTASSTNRLWSWSAADCAEIPADLKNAFATTDECKPVDDGKHLLVSSSGGGCALLELPSGKALWWARVTNAHSIEALPGGRIAVASSVGKTGDKVVLFDRSLPGKPVAELPLKSAHGLVWDDGRKLLWALGYDVLIACRINGDRLEQMQSHKLPDADGHDLRAVPGSQELILSTHKGVWLFDREKHTFHPQPRMHDWEKVKGIDIHPTSGRIAVVRAEGGNWWTDTVRFLDPEGETPVDGEKILYKARWMTDGKHVGPPR